MQHFDSKSLLNHGLKILENGGLVIRTMKAAEFCQMWPLFMHLTTKTVEGYNIKHVELHVLSSTRPKVLTKEIYMARYHFYGKIV